MLSNAITATAAHRTTVAPPETTTAPTAQHRYLPSAQPGQHPPAKLSKAQLVARIKDTIAELVHREEPLKIKNSLYLSQQLDQEYAYLARIFSAATGSTIERYIIAQKIGWVKELLLEEELSISQIAYRLNYSNVGHLCNQFKKVTGVTPSFFQQLMRQRAISLSYLSQEVENDVIIFCNPVIINLVRHSNFAP
ncbi:hypothetical protein GCM10028824_37760 [Hymenobacter segetis]|uniref:AraC family transcriptional regulator n=1 Tax=Hymenobacter segetis TaxID=2025509 RepID=A0ABU9LT56_9BACT